MRINIQGRYRGVLVYSPDQDTFLESAAALTLYPPSMEDGRERDRFRIEQIQYSSDSEGKQLLPVPDIGDYLGFAPREVSSSPQGRLPAWCAQASTLFNLLHMASMSAAEGSTNPSLAGIEQKLLDLIEHEYAATEKVLGRAAADELLGDWMKLIDAWQTGQTLGVPKALLDLAVDHAKDAFLEALPFNMGKQYQILKFTEDVANATIAELDQGINRIRQWNYQALKKGSPLPGSDTVDLSDTKPRDVVKQPKNVSTTLPFDPSWLRRRLLCAMESGCTPKYFWWRR